MKKVSLILLFGMATYQLQATEITWWHAMGGNLGETVNVIRDNFNKEQSVCKLTTIYKGGYEDTLTATISAFRAKNGPNITQIFDAGSTTIISAKGATIGVEDLFKQENVAFDKENYIAGVRNFYADKNGKMVGMPFNSSTPIMYYNTDILNEVGVEPPKTWEEFEQIAPKIASAGYLPLTQVHTPWIMFENFFSRNDQPMATNNDGYDGAKGTKLLFKNKYLQKFLEDQKRWVDSGWYKYFGANWDDNEVPFMDGKAAFILSSSGSFGTYAAVKNLKFATAMLPYYGEIPGAGTNTFIGGAALFAMKGFPKQENKCVVEFFEYLSKPETQYFWHKQTGYVPVTKAAYELAQKDGYYTNTPAAETGVKQLMLKGSDNTRGYRLGYYPKIRDLIYKNYQEVLLGKITSEQALDKIQTEGDEILIRYEKTVR